MRKVIFFSIIYFFVSSIYCQIDIELPDAQTKWETGGEEDIIWTSSDTTVKQIKIELFKDGKLLENIIRKTSDKPYPWSIDVDTGKKYQVKITDTKNNSNTKTSDEFQIIEATKLNVSVKQGLLNKRLQMDIDKADIKDEELKKLYRPADSLLIRSMDQKDSLKINKYKKQIENILKLDKESTALYTGRKFTLLGDVGLIKSISDSGKASGNGSFGLKYVSVDERINIKVLMLVANSNDKVKSSYSKDSVLQNLRDFGSTILTPTLGNNAGKSGTFEMIWYPPLFTNSEYGKEKIDYRLGLKFNIGIASQTWNDTLNHREMNVSLCSFDIGLIYDLIPLFFRSNKGFALRFNATLISRALWGDIYFEPEFQNRLTGETKRGFFGIKTGFELEFNGVVASMQFPVILNSRLKGLGKGQLVGGFSVSAGIPLKF